MRLKKEEEYGVRSDHFRKPTGAIEVQTGS